MKAIRQILAVAAALAVAALAGCSKEENTPDDQSVNNGGGSNSTTKYASISSDSDAYTANDNGGSILFGPAGGTAVITVDANVDWNVSQEGTDWLEVGVGTSSGRVTVLADQTTEEEDRTASLTFYKTSDGTSFAVVDITQTAYDSPKISVDADSWQAPAKGALTAAIAVDANVDWEVEDVSGNWLSAQKTEDGLVLAASENEDYEDRYAEVKLAGTDGITTATQTVKVLQDALAYLNVGGESLSFGAGAQSVTVTVESNFDWGFSFDSAPDWLSAEAVAEGLSLTVAEYPQDGTRECVIFVTAGDGAENVAEAQLAVVQTGANPDKLILEYTTTEDDMAVTLIVYGTVDCTVDWGDGNEIETVTSAHPTHTYEKAGVYQVGVLGTVTQLYGERITATPVKCLTDVIQWGNTGLTSMESAFINSAIRSVPADTRGAFSQVTTFYYAFRYCESLVDIDPGLFTYATASTTFNGVFYHDTALETVPDGLFSNCTASTTFSSAFNACTALRAVGAGLFSGCTATVFSYVFYNDTNLSTVPADILDGCTQITSVYNMFYGCTSLTSESPYTEIDGTKVHLYQRDNYPSQFATVSTHTYCFKNCTKMADYSSVPTGWK